MIIFSTLTNILQKWEVRFYSLNNKRDLCVLQVTTQNYTLTIFLSELQY